MMPFYGPRAMRRRVEPVGPANEPGSCGSVDGIEPTLTVRVTRHQSLRVRFGLLHSRIRCCPWCMEPGGTCRYGPGRASFQLARASAREAICGSCLLYTSDAADEADSV